MEIRVQFVADLIPLTLVQACGCHRWVLGAGSRANVHLVGLMMFKYACHLHIQIKQSAGSLYSTLDAEASVWLPLLSQSGCSPLGSCCSWQPGWWTPVPMLELKPHPAPGPWYGPRPGYWFSRCLKWRNPFSLFPCNWATVWGQPSSGFSIVGTGHPK